MTPHDLLKPHSIANIDDTSKTSICSSLLASSLHSYPRQENRRIYFDDECIEHLQEYIGLQDYTEKELQKCWYSREDRLKNEHRRSKVLKRMNEGKACEPNMTYRGLEYLTSRGGILLDQRIGACIDSVMDEQDQQWASGIDDFYKIATIASNTTVESKLNALTVALRDEQEAKLAYRQFNDSTDADTISVGNGLVQDSKRTLQGRRRQAPISSSRHRSSAKPREERQQQRHELYYDTSSKHELTKMQDPVEIDWEKYVALKVRK